MSKYLIKPISSIYLDPIDGVYDLKRDLLLYDNLGMLNLDSLLVSLHQYKVYPFYQNALNELEFLIKENKFFELKTLVKTGDVMNLNESDSKLAKLTMDLKTEMSEINEKNKEKSDELFWKHDELNTRLWCNITNANNDKIFTIPSLKDSASFELPQTTKEKAYSIIHNLIPLPSNDTPWEKIFDFNNDSESRRKLLSLKNWVNELPDNIKYEELKDKIDYLINDYSESLKRHKIEGRLSSFKTIVKVIPTAVTELIRLKFDKAIDAFFSIAEQEVNFQRIEDRKSFIGNELAYIPHLKKNIKTKK